MSGDDCKPHTYALVLGYDGTRFRGFGVQPGLDTIQKALEEALATLLGQPTRVTPAGRTDAGVHAARQVVSFRANRVLASNTVTRALNGRLPADVRVYGAVAMPPGFDARRAAVCRRYRYLVWNRSRSSPWLHRWTWHVGEPLDVAAMNVASTLFVGCHDFAAFAGQRSREPRGASTCRTVFAARCLRRRGLVRFDVSADSFLRHMVRGMVGTIVQVGRGRFGPEHVKEILESRDRPMAGPNAPARGLTLVDVEYRPEHQVTLDELNTDISLESDPLEWIWAGQPGAPA